MVKRFKTDIHNTVGFIQDPKKLKESIKQVYVKYVSDDTVSFPFTVFLFLSLAAYRLNLRALFDLSYHFNFLIC